jgi:DNA replicative helicase MCM subunit Mcm2 (Cdc46/Mcm family)
MTMQVSKRSSVPAAAGPAFGRQSPSQSSRRQIATGHQERDAE